MSKRYTQAQLAAFGLDPRLDHYAELSPSELDACQRTGGFVTPEQLQAWGIELSHPQLLWLPRYGAPAFQFEGGKLRAGAIAVNPALKAHRLPYPALGWWIWATPPELNGRTPVSVIGGQQDKLLHKIAERQRSWF